MPPTPSIQLARMMSSIVQEKFWPSLTPFARNVLVSYDRQQQPCQEAYASPTQNLTCTPEGSEKQIEI